MEKSCLAGEFCFCEYNMNITRERFWMALAMLFGLLLMFTKHDLQRVNASETSTELREDIKVFADVLAIVQKDYVRPVKNKELVEGAIKGMLAVLDPHSGYLDPTYFSDLQAQTKGEFGGLGIEITMKDGLLTVVTPMEDSPAERAGVKSGDVIVKIEGEYAKDVSLIDVVKKLRGPSGTPIKVSILREGKKDLLDITIIRDNIQIKSVKWKALGDGYGFVRINQFMESTSKDLKKALVALTKEYGSIKGLILDLRNNPGGLLTQAIEVSDLFLKSGVVVYTDGRIEAQKQKYYAHAAGTEPDYPIVVIVNEGSASASEIVSGALKDHGRALILGNQTFGKGSVQTINPLPNGGALQLTTALYYTKSGRSIQAEGVVPDVEINLPSEDEELNVDKDNTKSKNSRKVLKIREGDLPRAFKNPLKQTEPKKLDNTLDNNPDAEELADLLRGGVPVGNDKASIEKWKETDPYLKRALELLKTFSVFSVKKKIIK
jgi:carboxyl-terminal processing protease